MSDLIEREAAAAAVAGAVRAIVCSSAKAFPQSVVRRNAEVSMVLMDLEGVLRRIPASTRYAELERAARELLADINEARGASNWWCPTCLTWVPGKAVTCGETHGACNTPVELRDGEPEKVWRLRYAFANLDGGGDQRE